MNYPTNTFTKLMIATDINFANVVFYDLVNNPINFAEIKSLQYYTKYYWKVKTVQAFDGSESQWSDVCSFTTKGEDVTILHTTSCLVYYSFKNEIECARINGNICNFTRNTLEEYAVLRGYDYCGQTLSATRY